MSERLFLPYIKIYFNEDYKKKFNGFGEIY